MNKKDRFCAAYEHLRHIDKIRTQQDLADVMASTSQNVSRALSGDPKVLTDRFLLRFLTAYPDIFSMSWMFTGKGSMLLNDPQPKQSAQTYTLPEQLPEMAAESAPLSDRDLLAATYTSLVRLSDSFREYQSRTEAKLRVMESLLAHLDPSSLSSSPDAFPSEQDHPAENQQNSKKNVVHYEQDKTF